MDILLNFLIILFLCVISFWPFIFGCIFGWIIVKSITSSKVKNDLVSKKLKLEIDEIERKK